jgi:HEAT repeat protein
MVLASASILVCGQGNALGSRQAQEGATTSAPAGTAADRDTDVQPSDADAVPAIGSQQTIESLIAALADKSAVVRASAAKSLGLKRDLRAVKPLFDALYDSDHWVRCYAAEALDNLNWHPDTEVARVAYFVAKRNSTQLAKIGPPAIERLVHVLEDADFEVASFAAKTLDDLHWEPRTIAEKALWFAARREDDRLTQMGLPAVDVLTALLKKDAYWLRAAGAETLGKIGAKETIPLLIGALGDTNRSVQRSVASALDDLKWRPGTDRERVAYCAAKLDWQGLVAVGSPAVDTLVSFVREKNPVWQVEAREAAAALGLISDARSVEPLIGALEDKEGFCRREAAVALGQIADQRAIQPLARALQEQDETLRDCAAAGLGRIGPPAFDAVINVFHSADPVMRESAAKALGAIRDRRAIPVLVQVAQDVYEDSRVRRAAVRALGVIGNREAVPFLKAALNDDDENIRVCAAFALQKIYPGALGGWPAKQYVIMYVILIALGLIAAFEFVIIVRGRINTRSATQLRQ